jgi:fibronectin-binding autotransporter adhesin
MKTPARHTARRLALHALKAASRGVATTALLLSLGSTAAAQGNPYMAATVSGASFAMPNVPASAGTIQQGYTLQAWVNLGTQDSGIIGLGNGENAFAMLRTTYNSGTQKHTLTFTGQSTIGTPVTVVGGTFDPDTWTHVTAVFTNAGSNNTTLYVGNSSTTAHIANLGTFGYVNNSFGSVDFGSGSVLANGSISGGRVWLVPLSSAEVAADTDITDSIGNPDLFLNYAVGSTGYGPLTQGLSGSTTNGLTAVGNTVSNLVYTKYGSSNLTTQAGTTYNSSLAVAEGELTLGSANQLLDTGSLSVASGATLNLNGFSDTVGDVSLTGGAIINGTLNSNSNFTIEQGTVSVILGGSATLTKTTAGLATLSTANTYTGGTNVTAGTLVVTTDGALGTTAAGTQVASGAILDFSGVTYSTAENVQLQGGTLQASSGTSSFAGAIDLSAASIIDVAAGATLGLSGNMTETGGTYGLTKTGTGVLTISGSSLGYNGLTSVNAGELILNATLPGDVTAASGTTLLGGMTVNGTTTIDSGATLSVGSSSTAGTGTFGSLALNGDTLINLAAGINAGTASAGTDFDTIIVNTSLTYGGNLNLNFAGAVDNNDAASFSVFQITSAQSAAFTNVNILAAGSSVGSLTYNAGNGNWSGWVDLGFGDNQQLMTLSQSSGNLQVVPEPSSFALMGMGLAGLAAAGYRRRKAAKKAA